MRQANVSRISVRGFGAYSEAPRLRLSSVRGDRPSDIFAGCERIVSERRCGLPVLCFSTVIEMARNVKAFLNLEGGVTRGIIRETE